MASAHSPEVQEAEARSQVDCRAGSLPNAALQLTRAVGKATVTPDAVVLLRCICNCLPSSCGIRSRRLLPGVLLRRKQALPHDLQSQSLALLQRNVAAGSAQAHWDMSVQ